MSCLGRFCATTGISFCIRILVVCRFYLKGHSLISLVNQIKPSQVSTLHPMVRKKNALESPRAFLSGYVTLTMNLHGVLLCAGLEVKTTWLATDF
jgi:hypothetical protein